MNYNRKNVNLISLFISLSIFLIIIYSLNGLKKFKINQSKISNQSNSIKENFEVKHDIKIEEIYNWKIIIENLNLEANIKEGTIDEIIKENVGHYIESNKLYGNIALKAYNTGDNKNYFANLKELEIGDEIKYIVNDIETVFKVESNLIIENEEEYVEKQYKEDTIILITYIKDLENKKRCVIAVKKDSQIIDNGI